MGQIAIFGGTFNPPHIGHLQIARFAAENLNFDKVLVMPAKTPPHKEDAFATPKQRLEMCRLAFSDIEGVEVSDAELSLSGKSYTVKTLQSLAKKGINYPSLIIGADSLLQFSTWYEYKEILRLASLTVYCRAGTNTEQLNAVADRLRELGGNITLIDYQPIGISSTMVRETLLKNGSGEGKLLPEIEEYIRKENLYRGK